MSDNDSLKGKNGKVRVMYVRKEEEQEQTRRPSSRASADDRRGDQRSEGRSPWKTGYAGDDAAVPDHGGISGKSQIDPEQLHHQRPAGFRRRGAHRGRGGRARQGHSVR